MMLPVIKEYLFLGLGLTHGQPLFVFGAAPAGAEMPATIASLSTPCFGYAHWRALATFAARLRRLGKCASPFLSVARQDIWERLLEQLMDEPDFEWLMIDASHVNVHPHATGAQGEPEHGPHKRGLNSKIHLAVDAHGMPVRILITAGITADCTQTGALVEDIDTAHLIADKGYDNDAVLELELAHDAGMRAEIPPRKTRKHLREYDNHLYRLRYLVENVFLHLKQWRGVATRSAKNTTSFLAAVHIRCIALWSKIY